MTPDRRSREQLLEEIGHLERRLAEQTRIASYFSDRATQFLADVLPLQMWTATPDGRLDHVNSVVLRYFGRTFDQMIGEGWLDVVHPDDLADVGERWGRSLATGEPYEVKFRLRRHDGVYRWHIGRANAFRDEGAVRRWYGSNVDITEQVEQNAALARSASRHRLVGETVHDGLWFWEVAENELTWNDRLLEMLGMDRASFGGRFEDWLERVHPEDRAHVTERLDAHLTRREPYLVERFRLRQQDGSWRYFSTRGQAEFGPDGRPVRMAGGVTDIDQAKRTEDALRLLVASGRDLHGSADPVGTLERIVRAAVPDVADWCAVDLLDDAGHLQRVAVAHVDPEKVAIAHEIQRRWPPAPDDPTGAPAVVRTGVPEIHPVISDEMFDAIPDPDLVALYRRLGLRSSMCVPLAVDGRTIGTLAFVSAESGRRFGPADVAVATDLARRAGVAMHLARLHQEVRAAHAGAVPS